MKKLFLPLFFATFLQTFCGDLNSIMPRPKSAFPRETDFTVSAGTAIVVADNASPNVLKSVNYLQTFFKKEFGQNLNIVSNSNYSDDGANFIGEAGDFEALDEKLLKVLPHGEVIPGSASYILDISGTNIILAGRDSAGTFNAASTLALRRDFFVFKKIVTKSSAPVSLAKSYIAITIFRS